MWPPLLCRGELVDKTPFQFEIKDISLGGLGLFTECDMRDVMSPGDILENVEMDLDEHGFFCVMNTASFASICNWWDRLTVMSLTAKAK
ncbi:MAG: hypothetical protein ACR5LF_13345 [Symbiopectobacterium sp.]